MKFEDRSGACDCASCRQLRRDRAAQDEGESGNLPELTDGALLYVFGGVCRELERRGYTVTAEVSGVATTTVRRRPT